jgi:hypothetical protein
MSNDRNPFADSSPSDSPVGHAAEQVVNPYASPREVSQLVSPPVGVWQDGKLLVVHSESAFPPFCIRTNEPSQRGFRCNLKWSYPIDLWYRHVRFDVGLCESCIRRYRKIRVAGWGMVGAAVILFGLAALGIDIGVGLSFGGILLLATGIHLAGRPGVVLKIERAQVPYYWIRGAHPDFVARFPAWSELR